MKNPGNNQPHRICIIGNSGSGKSTLASALGAKLNVPVYHLDRELLHGNFIPYPREKQIHLHAEIVDKSSWIIDGNYRGGDMLATRVSRATMVVFLDVSRATTIPRIFKRLLINNQSRSSVPAEARNGMSWKFMKWVVTYSRKRKLSELRRYCEDIPGLKVIVLKKAPVGEWVAHILAEMKAET